MAVALIAELKRRRVFRALAAYAIVAFAVLQVIEPVIHGLHLPDSRLTARRVAVLLAAVGVLAAAPLIAWHFAKARGAPPSASSEVRTPAGASVACGTIHVSPGC